MSEQNVVETDLHKAANLFAERFGANKAAEGNDAVGDDVEEIQADGADERDTADTKSEGKATAESDDDGDAEGEVDRKRDASASEPPPSLSDDEKAAYKSLPPQAQALLRKYAERREGDIARHLGTKSGELAEAHRQFKAKSEEAVAAFGKRIESLDATVAGVRALIGDEPNWVDLAQKLTPEEFQQRRATWDHVQAKLKAAEGERAKLSDEAKAKFEERKSALIESHKAELLKTFKDPKGIDKAWAVIEPYLAKEGFSTDERGAMYDSRMWKVAHKAALWDKLQADKANVRKEAKPAAKLTKPGTTADRGSRDQARHTAAIARLKKSGSTTDAVAAFDARFGKQ